MIRIAVLISGRGSNMICLADAIQAYGIAVKITVVISNKDCAGITLAQGRGLQTRVIKRQDFDCKADQDDAIAETINDLQVDYIFLAGYMAILSSNFVDQFAGKIVNIHPSLLPAFKGLNTHQRAIDENVVTHGVSVHVVSAALDDGPMIIQARLPILAGDTADSLAARVLQLEHQIYPFVLFGLAKKFLSLSPEGARWHAPSSALAKSPSPMQNTLSSCVIWPT
jgi:phosphoribosylglycinamide formyltransferase-1